MKGIRSKGNVQIGFKFVLDKDNYRGIYQAAVLAKDYGATHFQFRPAIDTYRWSSEQLEQIWNQISSAQNLLEEENFKVMGIRHKFNSDLTKKHKFEKCRANLLTSTWCADGNVYMCTDTRGCEWSKLTTHYPNPQNVIKYWGSPEHLKKIESINFKRDCDRCTLSPYNEMFEEVFIKDKTDRNLI
jgi:MoaA/NifB/PqqE/SkfB family radical SAM enzyme